MDKMMASFTFVFSVQIQVCVYTVTMMTTNRQTGLFIVFILFDPGIF